MVPDSSVVRAWGGAGVGGRDIKGKQGDIYNTLKNKNKLKKRRNTLKVCYHHKRITFLFAKFMSSFKTHAV